MNARMNARLISFITEHGFRAEERDGAVWGEMAFSSPAGISHEWELVGTTVRETRDWLGY